MALALNVTVAIRVAESFGRHTKDAVVKHVQDVKARQAAAGVTRARVENDFQRPLSQADGFEGEFVVGHGRKMTNDE
jgi:hypothetical protein